MHLNKIFISLLSLVLIAGCEAVPVREQLKLDMQKRQGSKAYITGAFGVELGEPFEIEDAIGTIIDRPDGYRFSPAEPYEDFSTYYVIRTPQTGIVAKIHAYSEEMSEEACKAKYTTLRSLYFEKYTFMSRDRDDYYNDYSLFMDSNDGYLKAGCVGFVDYRLSVEYGNYDHVRTAKDERLEINKNSKSKSGL